MRTAIFDDLNSDNFNLQINDKRRLKSLINILNGHEEFIVDPWGKIVSSNLEAVTITGYEEWEVIGKSIEIIYPKEDIKQLKVEEDLHNASKSKEYITTDFKIKKHGDIFLAKTIFNSLYNSDGELNGYRIALSDATHNAIYKLRTRIINDEYANLFNNPYVGVFKTDCTDFNFLKLNEKALEILGLVEVRYSLKDIFRDIAVFDEFINKLKTNGQVDNFTFQVKHSYLNVFASVTCALFSKDGYVEGVIKDVSENWRQVIELQKLKAELDNFLYRASHDIRAPLTTILGLTNLIKSDKTGSIQELLEYAKLVENRVSHLDQVLKDLSDISYNNVYAIKVHEIQLHKLIERILEPLKEEFPRIKVIHDNIGNNLLYSDMARLKVVLSNVLLNGFKFHSPNSTEPLLKITYSINDASAIITIEDNGIGIDQNYLNNVFDVFFRINADGTGSGLGLFVTKSMVDRLGGHISIKSNSALGTRVIISIPNCIS
ncbi:hypothetical protein SanaruYs_36940 [Chryseotalea sanaruensis]|uniref:histidine kinase n=1 Tax=Chryseotalea sanaruensis TaxID=2482724 RepID=A0A401UF18_9BACT|nr:PAS domain-containing sensor histidine kinase [Chryseotalea sanaruensis]GCC53450.1 hypothetical protein SanaruYs_36940 [Chryseotalea sanaruensis]